MKIKLALLSSFFTISVIVLSLNACKKDLKDTSSKNINADEAVSLSPELQSQSSGTGNGYCWEDGEDGSAYDSVLKPTILGARLIGNPYSVANMQQASINLTNSNAGIVENAWYVRVKPSNYEQLAAVEDLDVDWFDYPLDYELVQEGDYYDDGVTPAEEIPWLYAVVNPNFTAPSGVTFQLLERIHVPNNYFLEDEAFAITGNNVDTADCGSSSLQGGQMQNNSQTECDCSSRPSALSCDCRLQCGFDTRNCTFPLPPVPPVRIPAGNITVTDDIRNLQVPVRNARMVARRFLKVERTYTNANGNYNFTKSFRNKVTLLIKFKNQNAIIKGLRGARLWQILLPVKINLGKFRGNINNVYRNVDDNNEVRSRGARLWAAATTHNAVQEFKYDYAAENIGSTPDKLRVLVVPGSSGGSAPMFAKRFISTLPDYFIRQAILAALYPPASYVNALATTLSSRVDVVIGYNSGTQTSTKRNDQMSEVCFHEFAHVAHYNKVGNSWYGEFVGAELNEMVANVFNSEFSPYGNGNSINSPIIALGESWAYHIGHWLTNSKYGILSREFNEQGIEYENNIPVNGLNSNLNLLEDFNPQRTNDPFRWIPQGLFYDLNDATNDNNASPVRVPLIDNVSNFTNSQFFNALDNDVFGLPGYRVRLLNENSNNQATGVNSIFSFYGY
ncbi:MAG: hypothetical protein KGZ74_07460 [Chitinophagaceae bacterium]|nr:hypothetical protein [Chitinophagaceae bacterium]